MDLGGPETRPPDAAPDAAPRTVTLSFQNLSMPTADYQGCGDTCIVEAMPNSSFPVDTSCVVGVGSSYLVRWDTTSIRAGLAKVQAAVVTLNTLEASTSVFEAFALRREWLSNSATWILAQSGQAWATAGARGASDRSASIGTFAPTTVGAVPLVLNAAGVAAVQSWIDDPTRNFGLILTLPAGDRTTIRSTNGGAVGIRPKLTVTYLSP
jgi:hypothetical protein